MSSKTVAFDFDGVIHSYTSGWLGPDVIPDPLVPGIKEAIERIRNSGYEVLVCSSRCRYVSGIVAIEEYLSNNNIIVDGICSQKPPAVCYIDDRAICFDGHPETLLSKIQNFKPWNK